MKRKILIVDDEEDMVEAIQTCLEGLDHEVIIARDGLEGLEAARREKPDLILLDVMMPKMNGFQVCRELKKRGGETSGIPIILLTAKAQESDKFWGQEAGCDDYVSKPFPMSDLVKKIDFFLKK